MACVILQASVRGWILRRRLKREREQKQQQLANARRVILVQAAVRGWLCRKSSSAVRDLRRIASIDDCKIMGYCNWLARA